MINWGWYVFNTFHQYKKPSQQIGVWVLTIMINNSTTSVKNVVSENIKWLIDYYLKKLARILLNKKATNNINWSRQRFPSKGLAMAATWWHGKMLEGKNEIWQLDMN